MQFVQKLTRTAPQISDPAPQPLSDRRYDEELEVKDLTWINASGAEMRAEEWGDADMQCFGMLMDGRARPTGVRQRGTEATMLLVLNSHHDLVHFTLLRARREVISGTCLWTPICLARRSRSSSGGLIQVTGRSLLLFVVRGDPLLHLRQKRDLTPDVGLGQMRFPRVRAEVDLVRKDRAPGYPESLVKSDAFALAAEVSRADIPLHDIPTPYAACARPARARRCSWPRRRYKGRAASHRHRF